MNQHQKEKMHQPQNTIKIQAIQAATKDIKSGKLHSGKQILNWMDTWFTNHETADPAPDTHR